MSAAELLAALARAGLSVSVDGNSLRGPWRPGAGRSSWLLADRG